MEFARKNGWSVEDGRILFPKIDEMGPANEGAAGIEGGDLGQQRETIQNMVGYARDLEMIV